MAAYREMSLKVREICSRYTDLLEPASIDEFYLDLTNNMEFQGSASLTMEAIRNEIRAIGIPGSAGISCQKMVAKIASEESKPDGQYVVPPEQVLTYIAGLNLKRIPGVGPKSLERLQLAGYRTGADIQAADVKQLQSVLGEHSGYLLHQRCLGIDERLVTTDRQRKQVSVESTMGRDIKSLREAEQYLEQNLLPALKKRLKIDRWQDAKCRAQTVKLKFSDFEQSTITRASNRVSPSMFYKLLHEAWPKARNRGIRLLGTGITLPDPDADRQLELDLD